MYCIGSSFSKVITSIALRDNSIHLTWTLMLSGDPLQMKTIIQCRRAAILLNSGDLLVLQCLPQDADQRSVGELHNRFRGLLRSPRKRFLPLKQKMSTSQIENLSFRVDYDNIVKGHGSSQTSETFGVTLCLMELYFQSFRRVSNRILPRIGAMRRNALS